MFFFIVIVPLGFGLPFSVIDHELGVNFIAKLRFLFLGEDDLGQLDLDNARDLQGLGFLCIGLRELLRLLQDVLADLLPGLIRLLLLFVVIGLFLLLLLLWNFILLLILLFLPIFLLLFFVLLLFLFLLFLFLLILFLLLIILSLIIINHLLNPAGIVQLSRSLLFHQVPQLLQINLPTVVTVQQVEQVTPVVMVHENVVTLQTLSQLIRLNCTVTVLVQNREKLL